MARDPGTPCHGTAQVLPKVERFFPLFVKNAAEGMNSGENTFLWDIAFVFNAFWGRNDSDPNLWAGELQNMIEKVNSIVIFIVINLKKGRLQKNTACFCKYAFGTLLRNFLG